MLCNYIDLQNPLFRGKITLNCKHRIGGLFMKKFITASLLCFLIIVQAMPAAASPIGQIERAKPVQPPEHNAASILVMDVNTGYVFFQVEGYTLRYPASITKMMTALLALEHVEDLDEYITISSRATALPWYAARLGVIAGETMTVREALYAIMLPSANEVARALAEHVSGTVSAFVDAMNRRAAELGALNTLFINPCGLPCTHPDFFEHTYGLPCVSHRTTAYDLALVMREGITHPILVNIISTPYFSLPSMYFLILQTEEIVNEERELRNTNLMVRPTEPEFDPRVIGGKTGFTRAAGHTLVTYAEYNGFEVIVVVLYAEARNYIFSDTSAILDYIFANFEPHQPELPEPPVDDDETLLTFAPGGGEDSEPTQEPENDDSSGFFENIDTTAALAATMSFALVGAAFLGLWKLYKYYEDSDKRRKPRR